MLGKRICEIKEHSQLSPHLLLYTAFLHVKRLTIQSSNPLRSLYEPPDFILNCYFFIHFYKGTLDIPLVNPAFLFLYLHLRTALKISHFFTFDLCTVCFMETYFFNLGNFWFLIPPADQCPTYIYSLLL